MRICTSPSLIIELLLERELNSHMFTRTLKITKMELCGSAIFPLGRRRRPIAARSAAGRRRRREAPPRPTARRALSAEGAIGGAFKGLRSTWSPSHVFP